MGHIFEELVSVFIAVSKKPEVKIGFCLLCHLYTFEHFLQN